MKFQFLLISLAFIAFSCSSNKKDQHTSQQDEEVTISEITEDSVPSEDVMKQEILRIAEGVQHSGFDETLLSKDFFKHYTTAVNAPGNNPGGIGDEEMLYNELGGQDPDPKGKFVEIVIKDLTPNSASAVVTFLNYGQKERHRLNLIYVDNEWRLEEWDNIHQSSLNYINLLNKQLKGDGVYKLLEQVGISKDDPDYDTYLQPLLDYKKEHRIR